jgi:hypothetical protein
MRKIREVLRLHEAEHLSSRAVGIAVGLPRSTVRNYIDRAREVGLHWPLPDDLDDRDLEERLFGRAAPPPAILRRPEPDWAAIHRELRRPHVTLMLLWTEYRERCHDGFAYSWFAERYRAFADHLDVVLRGNHRAGEKLFLDFAGDKIKIVDPDTGVISEAELFVAVLGASNYTYAEAVPSQSLAHWTGAHVRALEFFGGVPALLVPEYVPGNIFGLMWPGPLCGRRVGGVLTGRRTRLLAPHNAQSDASHLRSASSDRQTGPLRGSAEEIGGSRARSAASLVRVLISA